MDYRFPPKLSAVVFALMLSATATANSDAKPDINIYVASSYAKPDGAILLAEECASQILAKAGVNVHWLNCPPAGCSQARGPSDFGFHITRRMPPGHRDGALGFANTVHPVGGAGYSEIETAAFRRNMTVVPILGAVMAHEIGHWLLGAKAHSPYGVMRGNWGDYEFKLANCRSLTFTAEQNVRLRREVVHRAGSSE